MTIIKPIDDYEKTIMKLLGLEYTGLRWCELGNQGHWRGGPAKLIYSSLGVEHTSIDLNGKDGALKIDLDKPIPSKFLNKFDAVTNYGTLEHVNNQFQAFKNVHDLCKMGGVMIHIFPLIGNWPQHCRYYYSKSFARKLAKACNYRIINVKILDYQKLKKLVAATFIKQLDNEFVDKEEFKKTGIVDSGDLTRTGDYNKKRPRDILRASKNLFGSPRKIARLLLRKV